ncbi:MAG: (Fe-S)-binding protein [bacterium]
MALRPTGLRITMEVVDPHPDSVLIVYPQDRFALAAIQAFSAHGMSFAAVYPPDHLRDVAAPAVRVARSELGQVQQISKTEEWLHIGIVDWRPPAPDADRIERLRCEPGTGVPLLETVQMTYVAACMADATKLRFIAQFDRDIAEVMPYLNARIKGAVYTPKIPTLGFPLGQRMVTLYGTRLAVGKTDEIADSWRTMAWVKDLVNETWMKRDSIEPCTEERERPQPLEIYKRLPRTNCRECGEPTCMAFAARLARGEADLTDCPHLYRSEYEAMRTALLSLFPSLEQEGGLHP